ncbi:MAG: GntR family transcriptional regulator [Pseudomonadota bacterium]
MSVDITFPPADPAPSDGAKTAAHQQVYDRLRALILYGDLAPGQAVTIHGLVAQLGVGMTPVREALRRLIAEGALLHQGNRRVSVPVLSAEGVDELCMMRRSLEPELTRRAAGRLDAASLAQIANADARLNTAIAQGDIAGYLTHNHRFHALIYASAGAPIIHATVDQLWLRFGPSLRVVCGRFGTSSLPDMHRAVLAALAAQDAEAAAEAMARDVDQGMRQIAAALREEVPEHRFD